MNRSSRRAWRAGFAGIARAGIEGFAGVLAGEIRLPRRLRAALKPLRRGKRILPHGAIDGKPLDIWFVPPIHVSFFNPATLVRCVERAGFAVIARADVLELYARRVD